MEERRMKRRGFLTTLLGLAATPAAALIKPAVPELTITDECVAPTLLFFDELAVPDARITCATAQLLIDSPFLGAVVAQLGPSAFNSKVVAACSDEDLPGLLAHEAIHIMVNK